MIKVSPASHTGRVQNNLEISLVTLVLIHSPSTSSGHSTRFVAQAGGHERGLSIDKPSRMAGFFGQSSKNTATRTSYRASFLRMQWGDP